MIQLVAQVVASLGVLLLLSAFTLNFTGRLQRTQPAYEFMNLVGAGLSCAASALIGFVPFVILEGCWAAVAAAAIVDRHVVKARERRRDRPPASLEPSNK